MKGNFTLALNGNDTQFKKPYIKRQTSFDFLINQIEYLAMVSKLSRSRHLGLARLSVSSIKRCSEL